MVFSGFVVFYLARARRCSGSLHAPRLMIAAMLGYFVSTLIVQYITRYWKISTHAIGITAPLVALTLLYGRQPLPFLVLIPMVCWARVYLKAHTVAQVLAGAALAVTTTALLLLALPRRLALGALRAHAGRPSSADLSRVGQLLRYGRFFGGGLTGLMFVVISLVHGRADAG